MPSYVTPLRATEFIFYIGLVSRADNNILITNPTLAPGDFLVTTDGNGFTNLDTTPIVDPAGGTAVKVTVSIAEMTGDNIFVVGEDVAGAEWVSMFAIIQTAAVQMNDLASAADIAIAVWAAGGRTLTSYGTLVADVTTAVWGAAVRDLTTFGTLVADVADAVWDELIAGHAGIGSFGESITDIPTDVWAAGTRTLTSLAGLACDLWACPTRTLTQALSTSRNISSTSIDIDAADYMELNISGLGDLTGRTKLWMTLKKSKEDVDASAWFQIEETAGLVYINGTAAGTPANGSITVTNVLRGDITVELDGVETLKLTNAEGKGYFDIKWINAAGKQLTLRRGKTTVIADITRAVA